MRTMDPSRSPDTSHSVRPFTYFIRTFGCQMNVADSLDYARTLEGPWLLYDNQEDPYQLQNLVSKGPAHAHLVRELDAWLQRRLDAMGDEFLPGMDYIKRWGYPVDETGTVPYTW